MSKPNHAHSELHDRVPELERQNIKMRSALNIIRTWAACWNSGNEDPYKAMQDIVNKCDEATGQDV